MLGPVLVLVLVEVLEPVVWADFVQWDLDSVELGLPDWDCLALGAALLLMGLSLKLGL